MHQSGEDDLIARYFRPIAHDAGALRLSDDAAVLATDGQDLVVTTDAIVAGVHFFPDDPPDTIARKALRVNLSDLAAKGATPAAFVMTLALREKSEAWLMPFAKALGEDARTFNCALLGGDTVSTPGPLMISITAFGRVPKGTMTMRTGARAGDMIVVTGTIGDAALGLAILKGEAASRIGTIEQRAAAIARYRVPQPRTALAQAIRTQANAAMDVSDGLAGDLTKLCGVSTVAAEVNLASVPLSASARAALAGGAVTLEQLISGGDDYEILAAIPPERFEAYADEANRAGIAVTAIGTFREGQAGVVFRDAEGEPVALKRLSFSHF